MPPPSGPVLWAGGSIMLWPFYAFVFIQTTGESVTAALADAGANGLPLAALAAATHALLKAQIMPRTVPVQLVSHAAPTRNRCERHRDVGFRAAEMRVKA